MIVWRESWNKHKKSWKGSFLNSTLKVFVYAASGFHTGILKNFIVKFLNRVSMMKPEKGKTKPNKNSLKKRNLYVFSGT